MYFRSSIRRNPATDQIDSYYRLVESYRNETDRVCHRTLLNVGFLNELITIDELNQVRRIICKRYQDIKGGNELFDIQENNPEKVIDLADKLWSELVERQRIDIGGEWLCYQALEQLKLADFLANTGFSEEATRLAITQIILVGCGTAMYRCTNGRKRNRNR